MSEEIIKVLNYLGEQLGIAIDWSAENVMPQVMDILGRYRVYTIINNIISTICMLLILLAIFFVAKKCIKDITNKTEGIWWNCDFGGGTSLLSILFMIIGICIALFMFVCVCENISVILQWAIVPEIKYLEMLKGLMA